MSTVTVEFDLLCIKPNDSAPVYRVWVNNTLFTERVFRWNTQEKYLRENLTVEFDERQTYDIKIEKVKGIGEFKVEKIDVRDERKRDLKTNFRVFF
jgi:hypothetical protein